MTIPRDVRRIHDINIGDTVLFAIEGKKVDFFKMERAAIILEMAGAWKDKVKRSSVEEVRELRKTWEKRTKRLGL